MKTLYHCTTPSKVQRYKSTGAILPPVRGWSSLQWAREWGNKTGRTIVLELYCETAYPLPDHKPRGCAFWTPETIYNYREIV